MTKIEELEQKLDELEIKLDNALDGFAETLEIEIGDLRGELAELKESKKEGKWKPKDRETYWFRNNAGGISSIINHCDRGDNWIINNIPIFKTEKECERYWHFMDTVKEKSYEFSTDEWKDETVCKWFIQYETDNGDIYANWNYNMIRHFGKIYFKDKESAQYIIDNFKDELMEYFL